MLCSEINVFHGVRVIVLLALSDRSSNFVSEWQQSLPSNCEIAAGVILYSINIDKTKAAAVTPSFFPLLMQHNRSQCSHELFAVIVPFGQ